MRAGREAVRGGVEYQFRRLHRSCDIGSRRQDAQEYGEQPRLVGRPRGIYADCAVVLARRQFTRNHRYGYLRHYAGGIACTAGGRDPQPVDARGCRGARGPVHLPDPRIDYAERLRGNYAALRYGREAQAGLREQYGSRVCAHRQDHWDTLISRGSQYCHLASVDARGQARGIGRYGQRGRFARRSAAGDRRDR